MKRQILVRFTKDSSLTVANESSQIMVDNQRTHGLRHKSLQGHAYRPCTRMGKGKKNQCEEDDLYIPTPVL